MTDEELQQTMQEINESLDKLVDSEKPLTKEEKKRRRMLLSRKELLQKIKEARDNNNPRQEYINLATYSLLTSLGEKHPFLMHLLRPKFRWTIF